MRAAAGAVLLAAAALTAPASAGSALPPPSSSSPASRRAPRPTSSARATTPAAAKDKPRDQTTKESILAFAREAEASGSALPSDADSGLKLVDAYITLCSFYRTTPHPDVLSQVRVSEYGIEVG